MTFKAIIKNKHIELPPGIDLPDGTEVQVEPLPDKTLGGLVKFSGRWVGDDSDRIIDEIYRARSA